MLQRLGFFWAALLGAVLGAVPGVALCVALAKGGDWLAARLGLGVPGAALGLIVLALWLASGRFVDWSRAGAMVLARWIGAALVPVLVGLTAYVGLLAGALGPLALLLVVTTMATGVATALIYRWLVRIL